MGNGLEVIRRAVFWVVRFLAVLVVAAVIALQTDAARQYALQQMTEGLNARLADEVVLTLKYFSLVRVCSKVSSSVGR